MAHPGRNNIYDATIRRMVREALDIQEQEFLLAHGSDTDGQLIAYLQDCARTLKHTPWPREISGGKLIVQRFGTWENALQKAQLPPPNTPDRTNRFARIQEETERQKIRYRQKKAAKKLRAQQKLKKPPSLDG